jgi:hypothetical protein
LTAIGKIRLVVDLSLPLRRRDHQTVEFVAHLDLT